MLGRALCLSLLMGLLPALTWAAHSPESCGRRVIRQALESGRAGVLQYPIPTDCPRIAFPKGYFAVETAGGAFRIYEERTNRILLLITPPAPAPRVKDGVVGGQVWENGVYRGRVQIDE